MRISCTHATHIVLVGLHSHCLVRRLDLPGLDHGASSSASTSPRAAICEGSRLDADAGESQPVKTRPMPDRVAFPFGHQQCASFSEQ
jgi:hypothetical protein